MRELLARQHPHVDASDAEAAIARGEVRVDGRIVQNPRSLVRTDAVITIEPRHPPLRGQAKLAAAIAAFGVDCRDRVALDVGAAAGGFTRVLLEAGCRRVYAVDAGHGQLAGWLRQDARVIDLEGHNLGELDTTLVPDAVEIVTIDVSYLSLGAAAPQLERVRIAGGAELVALVKPQFELASSDAPDTDQELERALASAAFGFERAGWRVLSFIDSPVRGARGARELLLYARRR